MAMFKFGAPTPQAPSDGKIIDLTEVQTDGKGAITGSQTTTVQKPAPVAPDDEE